MKADQRLSVAAIVLTRNEERNLRECLESVRWAKEIIVVDAGSTDKTVQIARKYTRQVYVQPWKGFGAGRNYAIGRAVSDWILWIDADERVTSELANEIRAVVSGGGRTADAYSMPRKAFFLGKWIRHCGWYPGRGVRLFRRGTGAFSDHKVHERLEVKGTIGELESDLLHFTDPSLFHYFEKFNRYTSLAAEELDSQGGRVGMSHMLVRPIWTFVRMYFLRLGFLDGVEGFILCVNSALYVFTKYAKTWEQWSRSITRKTAA